MIKQFFLAFESREEDSFKLKHIQYNIQKKLHALKYIKYSRIDILFSFSEEEEAEILWDDGRNARLKSSLYKPLTRELIDRESIVGIYKAILTSLKVLWDRNAWATKDLDDLFREIEKENYSSFGVYGKTITSPDKAYKAEFFLEMFPGYTNYFLQFRGKGKEALRRVMFLKGFTDPFLFFGFFSNAYWRDNENFFLKDVNNEIVYIYNINEESYSIEYKPTINSLEQLNGYVRAFQFDVPKSEMYKLLGIPAP